MAFGAARAGVLPEAPVSEVRPRAHAAELEPVNPDTKNKRLAQLIADHYALVWRNVRRLGVPEADADDAVQEVFLVAARNLDAIEQERGYLLRTCMFVASHARRTIQRRREVSDDQRLDEEVDRAARPDESAEASQARQQLQLVLNQMPEELRAVFVLFELERFTMAEIADIMNLRSGTAASRLRRAREVFMTLASRSNRKRGER